MSSLHWDSGGGEGRGRIGPCGEEGSSNWLRSPGAPSGLNYPTLKWQLTDESPKLKQKERQSFETASLTPRNESKPCTVETEILSHYRETGVSQKPAVGPGEAELAQLLVQSQQGPTSGVYGWAGSRGSGPLGKALSQVQCSGPFLTSWVGERNGGLGLCKGNQTLQCQPPGPPQQDRPTGQSGSPMLDLQPQGGLDLPVQLSTHSNLAAYFRPTGATALQAPPLTEGPIPTTGPTPRHEPCPAGPSPQASPHPQGAINTFSCSRRCSSQALSTSAGCDSPRVHRAPHTCSCTRGSLSVMASSRMVDSPTVTKSDGRVRPGPGPPPGSASEDSASLARPLQPQAHTQPLLSTVPAGVCGTHWPPTLRSLWPPLPQPSNPGRVFSASPAQLDPSSYKKQAVWAQPHEAAPGGPLAHTPPWTMLWQRAGPGCRYRGRQSERWPWGFCRQGGRHRGSPHGAQSHCARQTLAPHQTEPASAETRASFSNEALKKVCSSSGHSSQVHLLRNPQHAVEASQGAHTHFSRRSRSSLWLQLLLASWCEHGRLSSDLESPDVQHLSHWPPQFTSS